MATVNLTEAAFEDTLKTPGIVLVDFWAAWCGPCRMFAPVFEKASEIHTDIVFAKVDTEGEQRLSSGAGIRSIPTLMAFRDGILLFNQAGALPAPALEQLISKLREVDMGEVRAQIAAEQATA
ncbi:MAG TPA: thioredoxin [Kineosporiaceae bacterium]|nr:thioredoxin [Kineosporiaceae bacterium]